MKDKERNIIALCAEQVRKRLTDSEKGHDWWHVMRVWQLSRRIAAHEEVNEYIADSKFHGGDEEVGPATAAAILQELEVEQEVASQVVRIVRHISFKGGNEPSDWTSPELQVVQDADRLDALGAIGIARTFHYGGYRNRALYDPAIEPNLRMTKEEYKKSEAPTINHFYEKLLLLKDRMHTATGKELAEERHAFMEQFLQHFFEEWNLTHDGPSEPLPHT
ncbi:MAG: HD domain-containing protein [Marinilabiliales bacterium]|nr:HD domain-containing protein [Marinilabiliales bacterium]